MLIPFSKLIGMPVSSVQDSGIMAEISAAIVDPDSLKIIAVRIRGAVGKDGTNLLDTRSIREYSPKYGMIIDSLDELISDDDVVKIQEVIDLHFDLLHLKVETKKGTKLGHVIDYTVSEDNLSVQQLIVKRPMLKSFLDSELTVPRPEIIEVSDDKIVVRDEENKIRERAMKEDFIPNFVNPFRKTEPAHSSAEVEKSEKDAD